MANRVQREARKIGLCACLVAFAAIQGPEAASGQQAPMPERSAGVFIGVEKFSHDHALPKVDYAVNDAVDLAHSLTIERGLLPPHRIVLLLAGEPSGESQDRLQALRAKGATQESATQANIYSLVLVQSRLVGAGGVFVLSIATHGYADGAEHLLLAEDSLLPFQTGVTAEKLLQATQAGPGSLRLLFIDACRTPFGREVREAHPRSAMPSQLFDTLAKPAGYVVFSASVGVALPGIRNGLFTGALVEGLRCGGLDQGEGFELKKLFSFVTDEVEKRSGHRQRPELRWTGGQVADLAALPPCSSPIRPRPGPISPKVLQMIQDAASYAAVGGTENIAKSFERYRRAFQDLPLDTLASLNEGQVAIARKLEQDSQWAEGVRIYGQLLLPLLTQSRVHPD